MSKTMEAPYQSSATAKLACGCARIFDPPARDGDHVICTSHGATQVVIGDTDWSYACPGCSNGRTLTRRYGQDEERAREAGRNHALAYDHTVLIKHAGKVISTFQQHM